MSKITEEGKKAAVAIFNAAAGGKQFEAKNHASQEWEPCCPFMWPDDVVRYPERWRIKPGPVTRPWNCAEDVPSPICWIAPNDIEPVQPAMVVSVNAEGFVIVRAKVEEFTWDDAQKYHFRYSTDRKTWHPCTVTEEAK